MGGLVQEGWQGQLKGRGFAPGSEGQEVDGADEVLIR